KKNDTLDEKPDKLDNNNIKKLLLEYLREFPQGKFNSSLDDDNLLDRMINSSTELSDAQKIEYQKIRRSINNMYKDKERDHYFVDPDDQEYISVFLDTSKATFEDVDQLIKRILKTKDRISVRELVKNNEKLLRKIDEKLDKKRKPLMVSDDEFKKLIKQFKREVIDMMNNLVGPLGAIDSVISCYKEVVEVSEEELSKIKKLILEQFSKQPDLRGVGAFFRFSPEGDFKYKMSPDPLNKHQFVGERVIEKEKRTIAKLSKSSIRDIDLETSVFLSIIPSIQANSYCNILSYDCHIS
ncbi:7957_t:CDS:2, partial [Dentiscutata erythropus]